jgi:hypothetical protein
MFITLTGVFYYELEHSLDNFDVKVHESYEIAVNHIYNQAIKYLQNCAKHTDKTSEIKELEKLIEENNPEKYDKNTGYQNKYSEFHHKIIEQTPMLKVYNDTFRYVNKGGRIKL